MATFDLNPVPESPDDAEPAVEYTAEELPPIDVAHATTRARRLKGYNLFLRGLPKSEIASTLGVSAALVSKWSKLDAWTQRRRGISIQAEDLLDQAISTEIVSAVKFMQGKINQRLVELDMACQRGSVTAIIAWLNRAGLNPHGEPEEKPQAAPIVLNDITIPGQS